MSNLRNSLIRLAHENPDLRSDILPLLERTASDKWFDDSNFRAKTYKTLQTKIMRDLHKILKETEKEIQLTKDSLQPLNALYQATSEWRKRDLESAVASLKSHYALLQGEKEGMREAIVEIPKVISDIESKGPMYGLVHLVQNIQRSNLSIRSIKTALRHIRDTQKTMR